MYTKQAHILTERSWHESWKIKLWYWKARALLTSSWIQPTWV